MIRTENVTISGREFVHTYSDGYFLIERNGIDYVDAYDPIDLASERIYTETDISIDPTPEDIDNALATAGRILLGMDEVSDDD
jgi:hypothetical protein